MRITVQKSVHLEGPNLWSHAPVNRLTVDLGHAPTISAQSAISAQLEQMLLRLHQSAVDVSIWRGDSFEGSSIAPTIGRLTISLQQLAGIPVEFSSAIQLDDAALWSIVIEQVHSRVADSAARFAVMCLNHFLFDPGPTSDFEAEFRGRFRTVVETNGQCAETQPLYAAAKSRGIPISPLSPSRTTELGNGVYRRRIQGASTSQTSHLGLMLSRDKHLTKEVLRAAGIPVPEGRVVTSSELAVKLAESIGFPVVVKPLSSGDSAGVALNLMSGAEVVSAFERAVPKGRSPRVIVERFIAGNDYRALVVNYQIVGIKERLPAHVIGDGRHTIAELIEEANGEPGRAPGSWERLVLISVDETTVQLLTRNGQSLATIPSPGESVRLKPHTRRKDGGTIVDRTDDVHPDNTDLLRWAARVVNLDIAGIDFVVPDITQSIWETGGAIIEVNDHPGIGTFLRPTIGKPRDPGPAIIDMLYPPGAPVRVPIVAISRSARSGVIAHALARRLSESGRTVGLAASDGLFVDDLLLRGNNPLEPWAARKILNHPAVEIAVIEVDPAEILERGLCFDYCDVALVTALSPGSPEGLPPPEVVLARLAEQSGTTVLFRDCQSSPWFDQFSGHAHSVLTGPEVETELIALVLASLDMNTPGAAECPDQNRPE